VVVNLFKVGLRFFSLLFVFGSLSVGAGFFCVLVIPGRVSSSMFFWMFMY